MHIRICGLALIVGTLIVISWTAVAVEPDVPGVTRADPPLIQFVQTVVESNPRVQAAQAALEASSAFRDAASRPLYNPELSLDAENSEANMRAIGISQTIDWGDKRKARTAVAESDRLVVYSEYLASRWALTVELLGGLAQHQAGVERDVLAQTRQQLMQDFVDLAQRRFDAGDLNQVELAMAKLASTEARIQKATIGADLAEARQTVRNLSPRSPAAEWPSLPTYLPVMPKMVADTQALVLALPEILAVRRKVDSADAVVELRSRERRPDPTISLAGGRENGETLVGLNVTMPLFVRNRFSDEVRVALAERGQIKQIANDLLQRAHSRLISATERYELSRSAWSDWELSGQTSLTDQTEQLQKLWKSGEISTTDYLVQLRQSMDIQESAIDLREAVWRAWFEWLLASGQLDTWLGQGVN